jgi:hypothetical protein
VSGVALLDDSCGLEGLIHESMRALAEGLGAMYVWEAQHPQRTAGVML